MNEYRADLHIHSVLSPCASLEMSPDNIIQKAKEKKLDIIGITDHNTTKQCRVIRDIGKLNGLFVLCGVEVNTKEDIHCLVFFNKDWQLEEFQCYLDKYLPVVFNKPELFGDQVWVDEKNNIIGEERRLLIVGIEQSLEQVTKMVETLDGILIPAHIDKKRYSVTSQIGFLPEDLPIHCVEYSPLADVESFIAQHKWAANYNRIVNSDAHMLESIGSVYNVLHMKDKSFGEFIMALQCVNGRRIVSMAKG